MAHMPARGPTGMGRTKKDAAKQDDRRGNYRRHADMAKKIIRSIPELQEASKNGEIAKRSETEVRAG
jgi:hypothetical protein